jgi:hypothetical protein
MNKFVNSLLAPVWVTLALASQTAIAGDLHDNAGESSADLSQAEYISEPLECTVIEVSTQYESGAHQAEFHCIEESGEADGLVYELEGLPSGFEATYRRKLIAIDNRLETMLPEINTGNDRTLRREAKALNREAEKLRRKAKRLVKAQLRAEGVYRSKDKIILTEDSSWSITEDTESINKAAAEATEAAEAAQTNEAGASAGVAEETISVTNESNVLVLHVTSLDSQTSASPSELSDSVFGTYGDPINLATQYDACSYGKKTFVAAQGADIVDGVAQISIGINSSGASRTTVMNAVTTAANDLLGSLSSNFDHVLYALPPGTSDSWIAYGYFNNYRTVYNNSWATKVSAQMHEVGHNFYLQHSSEGSNSYGDQQGMMGYSYNQDDSPVMCFNAAKSSQLSWYNDKELTISSSWSGKVIGLANYDNASSEQNVILKVENGDGDTLFVTYNRKSGVNSGTSEAGNQVTVVRGGDRQTSSLLAKLNNGSTYTLPDFWNADNDLVITIDDITTDFNSVQYALVNIENNDSVPVYALTVNSGNGNGSYASGAVVSISASAAPSGQEFDRWAVNSGSAVIANAIASSTSVTMPSNAATVTATYKDQPPATYSLTVNSGSGDGSYASGAVVNISASAAPSGQEFDRWVVNSGSAVIANTNAASTSVTMPSNAATVTATYKDQPSATYSLTVSSGNGDGSYTPGAMVNITADAAPLGQEFVRWVIFSGNPVVANVNAASTTLTMGSTTAGVTAEYKDTATDPLESPTLLEVKIYELYVGILGRAADQPGMDYWVDQISNGPFTLENVRASFTNPDQSEYTEIYAGLGNTQLVSAVYQNFLERLPEVAGLLYWMNELDNNRINPDQMINAVINAVQNPEATNEGAADDSETLHNKIEAAAYFTAKTRAYIFDATAREAARAAVADVNHELESLEYSKEMTDAFVSNLAP